MNNKKTAQVYHFDLYGTRDNKYEFLHNNSLKSLKWNELNYSVPNYFFVKKDFTGSGLYETGFKIDELFLKYNNGIETGKDTFFYSYSELESVKKVEYSFKNKDEAIRQYAITNTSSFRFLDKFKTNEFDKHLVRKISYRPFDIIHGYYAKNLQRRPAYDIMRNMLKENLGLLTPRQVSDNFKHVFISKNPTDCNLTSTAKKFGSAPIFPLYLYPEKESKTASRTPNLNSEIVQKMADGLGLKFTNEKESDLGTFAPIDILDYIYAVLHSPTYREKYKEFLKIDFPRVPYPKDKETFWKLVRLGGELRQIHLLESPAVEKYITKYPVDGDNVVNKIKYQDGNVLKT